MHKRKPFTLAFFIVCVIVVAVCFLFWFPGLLADRKLQSYVERLEKKGYYVEEGFLSDFLVDDSIEMKYYSDLTYAADWESVHTIYFDRKMQAIYFLKPIGDKTEAYIFHYMLARDE